MLIVNKSGDSGRNVNNFTVIPNYIYDLGLTVYAIALYGQIRFLSGESPSGFCKKSIEELAALLVCHPDKVEFAKRELVRAGIVEDTQDGMRTIR